MNQAVKREWQAFWLATGFLTRIPMLARIDYSQRLMNQSSVYFPLIGLLLGGLYAGLYSLLVMIWPALISLILVLCFHLWLTGAFHEDGLADSVDGLGGGLSVARRLAIMKDSSLGTYGALSLVCALGLKAALLLAMPQIWLALLLAPCFARLTPLLLMRLLPYVSNPDTSKTRPVAEAFGTGRLLVAVGFVVIVGFMTNTSVAALAAVTLVSVVWGSMLVRLLGGYTGDTLGASVVFTELVFLLALLAIGTVG